MLGLDGELTVEEVAAVAREGESVTLGQRARERMADSRAVVDRLADANEESVYGVNTGFGNLKEISIGRDDLETQQLNLLRSHHTAVGDPLPTDLVRAILLVRANALAVGVSGVRPLVVERLCELLNAGIHPVIPDSGSADNACELANVGLVLVGEGEAHVGGDRVDGETALADAGIDQLTVGPKEGIALISGTSVMTAQTALGIADLERLVTAADVAGAWTFALVGEESGAFDERVFEVRPVEGHATTAANIRELIGAEATDRSDMTQDPLSIRCLPQANGSLREFIEFGRDLVETELASATDNPLVFPDGTAHSCGHFNGQHVAGVADSLALSTVNVGHGSERRSSLLLAAGEGKGLTPHLASDPGLESGMARTQYAAASLITEAEALDTGSDKSFVTSTGQEDLHAAGNVAGANLLVVVEKVRLAVAVELLCCARATQLADADLSEPLAAAMALLDDHVDLRLDDCTWSEKIETVAGLVRDGTFAGAIEETGVDLA